MSVAQRRGDLPTVCCARVFFLGVCEVSPLAMKTHSSSGDATSRDLNFRLFLSGLVALKKSHSLNILQLTYDKN